MTVKELKEKLEELIKFGGEDFTVLVPVEEESGNTEARYFKVCFDRPETVTIY